jgi:hypothetical protein
MDVIPLLLCLGLSCCVPVGNWLDVTRNVSERALRGSLRLRITVLWENLRRVETLLYVH